MGVVVGVVVVVVLVAKATGAAELERNVAMVSRVCVKLVWIFLVDGLVLRRPLMRSIVLKFSSLLLQSGSTRRLVAGENEKINGEQKRSPVIQNH